MRIYNYNNERINFSREKQNTHINVQFNIYVFTIKFNKIMN